jgi:hypothetical protein
MSPEMRDSMTKHGHHNELYYDPDTGLPSTADIDRQGLAFTEADQRRITADVISEANSAPPLVIGNIDMCKLRDLLFSIRDNQIYCPICRCPEFAAHEMRTSHFEPCTIGEICEKFLSLYPREGYVVKWRK